MLYISTLLFSVLSLCVCVCVFCLSRLLLLPGFLPLEQADWMFSKLLAELPWSQKTNYRQGGYQGLFSKQYEGVKCEPVM